MTPVQIKICGVTNVRDAKAAAELGASMIGFNFYPQSPRHIEPENARQIVEMIPRSARAVGVFVDASADEIRNTAKAAGVNSFNCTEIFARICRELAREFRVIRAFCTDDNSSPRTLVHFPITTFFSMRITPDLQGGTGLTCDAGQPRERRYPLHGSSFSPVV
jgi:phosphoribosylanthranilate isomerase